MKKPVILCIDDDPTVLEGLSRVLTDAFGYKCVIELTSSGENALERIDAFQQMDQELVLTIADVNLLEMPRADLLITIHQKAPKAQVIVLTNQGVPLEQSDTMTSEVYRYIAKPWDQLDLCMMVKGALSKYYHEQEFAKQTQDLQDALAQIQEEHQKLKEAQTQLVHSEKMASLGILVSGVAHEIKNPVNFVNIGAQNAQLAVKDLSQFIFDIAGDDVDPEIRSNLEERFQQIFSFLETVHTGSVRIKSIVADLSEFSRLQEMEKQKIRISESIEPILRLIRTEYKNKIIFTCDLQDDPEVECWPTQLGQVFMNVIVNACQAIKASVENKESLEKASIQQGNEWGGLTIRTFLEEGQAAIQFEDTGCGMSEEVQAKMFEPFYTTKGKGEGTGLGMSISHGIIKKHHGVFKIDSILDQGTTITILLPLNSEKPPPTH